MKKGSRGRKRRRPARPIKKRGRNRRRKRVRPTVRANVRRKKIQQRPMPAPPTRRKVVRKTAAKSGTAEMQADFDRILNQFERLEGAAQLSSVYSSIGDIDTKLTELPTTVEKLRDRGYVHSGQLEDMLAAIDDRWDEVRPKVETALASRVRDLDKEMEQTERRLNRLTASAASLKKAETAVNGLERQIRAAESAISGLYDGMEAELYQIERRIAYIDKMLTTIDQSQEIQLRDTEGPLLLVEAEWEQDGEEGPDGYLLLTDQRLLFEQKEEIVTKKRFGIFKADSEMVQKLLLDIEEEDIESISHKEEGGFLGMGKDDILELVFSAKAPISRGRFHLKGQNSSDWAAMINRVQSDDINEDRADEYVAEIAAAEAIAASFPSQCPSCLAELPPPPRGVPSVTCDFCNTVISPT